MAKDGDSTRVKFNGKAAYQLQKLSEEISKCSDFGIAFIKTINQYGQEWEKIKKEEIEEEKRKKCENF